MQKIQRNIQLIYAYLFLNRLELWIPVIVLFLQDRGFTLTEYTILDAVWYASTLIFEIPTGIVTDRYGTKISLLISGLAQAVALFLTAWAHSFAMIFFAYVLWGFGASFETGTYDVLLYDSLKQCNRESDYRKVRGRVTTLSILAAAIGSILAGFLGGIELALPIFLTGALAVLTLPLILALREPEVSQVRDPSHLVHLKESVRYISRRRFVALLILYSAIMSTAIWGLHEFYQPFLSSFGIQVETIGILYLFFRLFSVAGAHFSDALFRIIGRISVFLIPPIFVVSVLAMGSIRTPWVIAFIFVIYFLNGFYLPIVNDLLNKNLPSSKRATIISLGSVISCLLGCILYPMLGRIADLISLQRTFQVLGFGMLGAMALLLFSMRREAF
ncbi:MAG TPA: MFS transporter [Anaerolineae bacterium]|nr:MFS transporter [Anaerolineae bacterium]